MISFAQFRVKESLFSPNERPRQHIENLITILSYFEPKDTEENKDVLFTLQDSIHRLLTGGN